MSGPNFAVKVPTIPLRPIPRSQKTRKRIKAINPGSHWELETIVEAHTGEAMSYYSLKSPESSSSGFNVLETYDEYLNLKDLERTISSTSSTRMVSKKDSDTNKSVFLLKQICTDLSLGRRNLDQEHPVVSLYQSEIPQASPYELQTAIIAQRIMETEKQIADSKKSSKSGVSPKSPLKKSTATFENYPCSSSVLSQPLSKTLSNLTSRYLAKPKCMTSEVQANFEVPKQQPVQHSCNTQTASEVDMIIHFKPGARVQKQAKNQHVQSVTAIQEDKFTNTVSVYPQLEQFTQMYEHITENDLLCMEWINRNLFKVPVNPYNLIVDEKLKESSEFTCFGTNMLEQELNWELQALCT